jgi:hypothetical protein
MPFNRVGVQPIICMIRNSGTRNGGMGLLYTATKNPVIRLGARSTGNANPMMFGKGDGGK